MIAKIYKTVNGIKYYSTTVIVHGREQIVTFEGGSSYPVETPAKYTATTEEMVAALEKAPAFNRDYELMCDLSLSDTELEVEDSGLEKVTGIATVQAAKEYLLSTYKDLTHAKVLTKELIFAVAKEKGIELIDLK